MQFTFPRFAILFFSLITSFSYSQGTNSQKDSISKKIEDYFFLERENIHLHFSKTTFFTGEKIWLKGYVYHRKKSAPFFSTTNVYASLYNDKGDKIEDKLFYAKNGSFIGNFELDDELASGKYYVHVFTNWMKNFKEDESSTYKIDIINKNDSSYNKDKPDYSQANITFYPEGGTIIEGVKNNVGIKVSDCNGNPLPVSEGELINPAGQTIQKISVNKFGFGKFELLPDLKTYKVRFTIDDKKMERIIPAANPKGITLEANSYAVKDKTIIKIKTNAASIETYISKPVFMVVHQDDKTAIFDVDFKNKNLEQTIAFTNDVLFPGVNTIRIIDSENNQLAERLIFKYQKESLKLELGSIKKEKDTAIFNSRFNFINTNISISVLPEETFAFDQENDIYGDFLLNPYFNEKAAYSKYYFNEITPKKAYELDMLLLSQESSKYKWQNIKNVAPKTAYDFDFGLTLKGTVNQTLSNPKSYRINMLALQYGINEATPITEKNEFYFNNLVLEDGAFINFNLIDEKNRSTAFKVYPQLLNGRRSFNKAPQFGSKSCPVKSESVAIEMPQFAPGSITLDDVEINKTFKKKSKQASKLSNSHLIGFQITEKEHQMDLLQFIQIHGFELVNDVMANTIQILSRTQNSYNAQKLAPLIYLDDIQLQSADMLLGIRMTEIDEIYLNPHAIVPSIKGNMGVIKIYRKNIMDSKEPSKSKAIPYIVKQGFSKNEAFKNIPYTSTTSTGFRNFGLIDWIPNIITNQTSNFTFKFPLYGQKKVKLLIEGFSADGKLISEIRTVDLE